jgi:REP element-mobilizing transposase RayT
VPDRAALRHRRSIRLSTFDYGEPRAYFVTICTFRRECTFDDSLTAAAVLRVWRSVVCRGNSPLPGDFIVMPNHVHGIVWLGGPFGVAANVGAQHQTVRRLPNTHSDTNEERLNEQRLGAAPLQDRAIRKVAAGSLGAVVRSFKARSTKLVNRLRGTAGVPVWQRNYYERVVRDDDELIRIREYILDNPRKWADDPNHPDRALRQ